MEMNGIDYEANGNTMGLKYEYYECYGKISCSESLLFFYKKIDKQQRQTKSKATSEPT
jgi:hypothetical protein